MQTTIPLIFVLICIQCISIIKADTDEIEVSPEEFDEVADVMNFKGKVVLITGSSSGIGATTARLFARLGAQVVVTGRDQTRVNKVVKECCRLSPNRLKPLGVSLDLSDLGNIAILVNRTITAYNKIDILVNAAGINNMASINDPKFNQIYREAKTINEESPIELTRLCIPHLQRSRGSIVFIASIIGWNPVRSFGSYSMSKSSITAFAKALTHDIGQNVRVNIVSPGITDGTRIFRSMCPSPRESFIENSIKSSSLGKIGVPLDIAKLVVFLSSNLASSLNGKELHADQGLYIPIF